MLVVGVFPAAPLACCMMLWEFPKESPHPTPSTTTGRLGESLSYLLLGFSFKAPSGTSLISRCVERWSGDCPGLS